MRLTLPYPPSTNRIWRNFRGITVKSQDAVKYKKAVEQIALAAKIRTPVDVLVSVVIKVFRPRKVRDLDNCLKAVFDSLNGICWRDDKQVIEIHAFRYDDKENPRIEIEVLPAEVR